jgi:hypothetical protein
MVTPTLSVRTPSSSRPNWSIAAGRDETNVTVELPLSVVGNRKVGHNEEYDQGYEP